MTRRPAHVLGFYGTQLDGGARPDRWERWRPTLSLFQHEALIVDRLDLLVAPRWEKAAALLVQDIAQVSPDSVVVTHPFAAPDPWDFQDVYEALDELVRTLVFQPDDVDHFVHLTTGTHVAQICLFLLTESRQIPGRLIQTGPSVKGSPATWSVVDLELSRYDRLAARFKARREAAQGILRSGIPTLNPSFAALVEQIERVATAGRSPILLQGPTGSGKTRLARRIHELKRERRMASGNLVELNCATLRGDQAMSALFGHVRGAFTGAATERAGLLRAADKGVLFLDEIAELGLDEQAMLLRALEDRRFLPVGSDREVASDFQLVAGSHQNLRVAVAERRFREDLLARIDLWTFHLPGLADRKEDVAPNLDWELDVVSEELGRRVRMNREARAHYLAWATGPEALWAGSFRDLHASVVRMATLADGGRIDRAIVDDELTRVRLPRVGTDGVAELLGERADALDRFDRVQLNDVIEVCQTARSLSEAGRTLFAASRAQRTSVNDADRLRKYLARFELSFEEVQNEVPYARAASSARVRTDPGPG